MPKDAIVFTHIPKTGGVSVISRLFAPSIPENAQFVVGGARTWWRHSRAIHQSAHKRVAVMGHISYGLHGFLGVKPQYIVMLREPVSWALSYYYFILQCDYEHCKHTEYIEASQKSILEFYQSERQRNLQSRMILGFFHSRFPTVASALQSNLAARAIERLRCDYTCFGIFEEFEPSLRLFSERLGLADRGQNDWRTRTIGRPRGEGIGPELVAGLRDLLRVDIQVYEWAREQFQKQCAVEVSACR